VQPEVKIKKNKYSPFSFRRTDSRPLSRIVAKIPAILHFFPLIEGQNGDMPAKIQAFFFKIRQFQRFMKKILHIRRFLFQIFDF